MCYSCVFYSLKGALGGREKGTRPAGPSGTWLERRRTDTRARVATASALSGEQGAARSRGPRWKAGARPSQDGSAGPAADRPTPVPRPGRPVWPASGQALGGGLTWARSRGRSILGPRPRRSGGLTGSLGRRPAFRALFVSRWPRVFPPSVRRGVGALGAGGREESGGAWEAVRPRPPPLRPFTAGRRRCADDVEFIRMAFSHLGQDSCS